MTFSVTPTQGFVPPEDEGFPNFIQFQQDGVDLGGPDADTVNFINGLSATRGTGENENVVTVTTGLTWRRVDGDGAVVTEDVNNGIRMTAVTGAPVLSVGAGFLEEGNSILVAAFGADVTITSTPSLIYRSAAFQAKVSGGGGIATLIGMDDGSVLLCGDLVPVA